MSETKKSVKKTKKQVSGTKSSEPVKAVEQKPHNA